MEILHTHFWAKDMMDNMEHGTACQATYKEHSECGSTSDMLRELIQQKKSLLMGRLASLNSEAESHVCILKPSEAGSITTNPSFQRGRRIFSSIRSAVSNHDLDGRSGAASPSPKADLWPT